MDSRTSLWLLAVPLAAFCGGCVTTHTETVVSPSSNKEGPAVTKAEDLPKRNPLPATEIEFGKLKEMEADSEASKKDPETQARLRDMARRAYQHALELDKNNLEAQRLLGKLYAKMGDYQRATEVLKTAMTKHPKDASLWYDLGLCHNRQHQFPESVRCFNKALELDPENRDFIKMLGLTLAWDGNIDQGLKHLTRVQGAAMAHFNIACVLYQKHQDELAKQYCRLARRENGDLLNEARELLADLENPGRPQSMVRQ